MGFFDKALNSVLRFGKSVYNTVSNVAPYAIAGVKTLINHPSIIPQLAGLAGGALATGAEALSGNIPASIATGSALLGMGQKTYTDVSKAFKQELANVKKGGAKAKKALKMSADGIANLKKGIPTIAKKSKNININE